jgi:hypothetical protein
MEQGHSLEDLLRRLCPVDEVPHRDRQEFCSERCRGRARRRWARGLAADAYPAGAKRGRVPMGQPTRDDETFQAGVAHGIELEINRRNQAELQRSLRRLMQLKQGGQR